MYPEKREICHSNLLEDKQQADKFCESGFNIRLLTEVRTLLTLVIHACWLASQYPPHQLLHPLLLL